jgi:hypothetical protein
VPFRPASSFKATGVVKNETWVASEYHSIVDVVQSTLTKHLFTIGIKDQSWLLTVAEGAMTEVSICTMIISIDQDIFQAICAILPLLSKISGCSVVLQIF